MIKNAMEPQCFKWWEFPSIPGYWFSVRTFSDGSTSLLSMQQPKDFSQVGDEEDDFRVLEWDTDFEAYLDGDGLVNFLTAQQSKVVYKHFGIKGFPPDSGELPLVNR